MVGRKKKTKICDKGPQEDWINKLPDDLISEILCHLPTKDAVRTSLLSTRWRTLWQLVPGLDLDSRAFSNVDAFVSFADRFFDSHKKSSWIRKLCLSIHDHNGNCVLTPWVDAVTTRSIQHLDLHIDPYYLPEIPSSIYTCQTLVHLRLYQAPLVNAEFVSLPCLKIIHLEYVSCRNGAAFEKLISGSPVLEDLTLIRCSTDNAKVLQVRSHSLKRIRIDERTEVEIDAPLLQCLRTKISSKNFKIINLGNSTKLDIDVFSKRTTYSGSFICDILTDIERVRDLVISSVIWEDIFLYSESGPLLQFRYLSRLNAKFFKSDLEMLPTILESCPKLEFFILNLVKDPFMRHRKNIEPKVMFSTVPPCLVSSLKFVELKRSTPRYEGEMELVRYFLKNSTILEKLRLDTSYYTNKAKCAFLKELLAMSRCSTACEVLVL